MPKRENGLSGADIGAYLGAFLLLAAVLVFGWEVYTYFRDGDWTSITLATLLQWFGLVWANHPNNWFGLFSVLHKVPLAVALVAGGAVVTGFRIQWQHK